MIILSVINFQYSSAGLPWRLCTNMLQNWPSLKCKYHGTPLNHNLEVYSLECLEDALSQTEGLYHKKGYLGSRKQATTKWGRHCSHFGLGSLLSLSVPHHLLHKRWVLYKPSLPKSTINSYLWVTSALNILPSFANFFCILLSAILFCHYGFLLFWFLYRHFCISVGFRDWGKWNTCSVYHDAFFKIPDFLW